MRTAEIESGARRSHFRTLDIGELFRHIADIYQEVAEDAGDALIFDGICSKVTYVQGGADLQDATLELSDNDPGLCVSLTLPCSQPLLDRGLAQSMTS